MSTLPEDGTINEEVELLSSENTDGDFPENIIQPINVKNNIDIVDAEHVNKLYTEMIAIQLALGINLGNIVKEVNNVHIEQSKPTFTMSDTRVNIESGIDNMSTMLGKISKYFADLRILAFKTSISKNELSSELTSELTGKLDADTYEEDYTEVITLINTSIDSILGNVPSTLNTLGKIASAIDNDPEFYTTVQNALNEKRNIDDPIEIEITDEIINVAIPSYTTHTNREPIVSGTDNISVIFGKIAKYLQDLGSMAYKSNIVKTDFDTALITEFDSKLSSSVYNATDVLAKLKTVDGIGSGLDADTIDGYQLSDIMLYSDNLILGLLSGVSTDLNTLNKIALAINNDPEFSNTINTLLEGKSNIDHTHDDLSLAIASKLNASLYTAENILNKLKNVDGAGSELDADTIDGYHYDDIIGYIDDIVSDIIADLSDVANVNLTNVSDSVFYNKGISSGLADADHVHDEVPINVGDVEASKPTFIPSDTRLSLVSGTDTLSIILGKIAKYILDFKVLAFKDNIEKSDLAVTLSNELDGKLDTSVYTANDILTKLKTVDGIGSGLDSETIAGLTVGEITEILTDDVVESLNTLAKIANAIGNDPNFSTSIYNSLANKSDIGHTHTDLSNSINTKLDVSIYTAADILLKLKTVDGVGSGLDSETIAGLTVNDLKAYTNSAIAELIGESSETLNTLYELAAALGNDPNFSTTILNLISTKADLVHSHADLESSLSNKLESSEFNSTNVVDKVKALDGANSGIDADLIDGKHLFEILDGIDTEMNLVLDTLKDGVRTDADTLNKLDIYITNIDTDLQAAKIFLTDMINNTSFDFDSISNLDFYAKGIASGLADADHTHTDLGVTDTAISNSKPTFTRASTRSNLVSSTDTLSVMLGKISKYFNDIRSIAYLSSIAKSNLSSSLQSEITGKLDSSGYTAADILTKLKTVDGVGSLLDADTVDGLHSDDVINNTLNSIRDGSSESYNTLKKIEEVLLLLQSNILAISEKTDMLYTQILYVDAVNEEFYYTGEGGDPVLYYRWKITVPDGYMNKHGDMAAIKFIGWDASNDYRWLYLENYGGWYWIYDDLYSIVDGEYMLVRIDEAAERLQIDGYAIHVIDLIEDPLNVNILNKIQSDIVLSDHAVNYISDYIQRHTQYEYNPHNIDVEMIGAVPLYEFSGTLYSDQWENDSAPFTQTVSIEDMYESISPIPIIDITLSSDWETSLKENSEWGYIVKIEILNGGLEFYASKIPSTNINFYGRC